MPNYIDMLKLEGHEEGGYFALFYKSEDKVIPLSKRYQPLQFKEKNIERSAGSSIYFLLKKQQFSAWHRLKSDEVWHHYDGSPVDIHVIDHDGQLITHTLGNPSKIKNASFQIAIKAGVWFAAELHDKSSLGLVGCTVSPAFEYDDFELAESHRDELVKSYPELTSMIDKFIKPTLVKSKEPIQDSIALRSDDKLSANEYIQSLHLKKHPEGGYFAINYTSEDSVISLKSNQATKDEIMLDAKNDYHAAGSAMYFLLDKKDFSAWQQSTFDEIWHYYDGTPINIHTIDKNGDLKILILGNPTLAENATFQVVIKAGTWFAAEIQDKTSFGLIGRTTANIFKLNNSLLANRKWLASQYPAHQSTINIFSKTESTHSTSWTTKAITYASLALLSGIGLYALAKENESINECAANITAKIGI